jgi:hypothetical protein
LLTAVPNRNIVAIAIAIAIAIVIARDPMRVPHLRRRRSLLAFRPRSRRHIGSPSKKPPMDGRHSDAFETFKSLLDASIDYFVTRQRL